MSVGEATQQQIGFGFAIRVNNLKLTASQALLDVARETGGLDLGRLEVDFGSGRHADIAEELRLARTEVYEVATFYHHFDVVREGETAPPPLTQIV